MPFVAPFKGLRYNPKKVASLKGVVTPPYDIISPEGQTHYYKRHRWNFVRVVFGKHYSSDTAQRNVYSRACSTLEKWIASQVLLPDQELSIYPYVQEYKVQGKCLRRVGVIALVRLNSPKIFPHEATRPGPKKDRLRLLKAARASLSPIFGLIPDTQGSYRCLVERLIREGDRVASFQLDGVGHRLWQVSAPGLLSQFQRLLKPKELVIADGHHRYEAACAYRDWRRRKRSSGTHPYDYAMFYLMASDGAEEPGLLPTHRVVRQVSSGGLASLMHDYRRRGAVRTVANVSVLADLVEKYRNKKRLAVGLYNGNGATFLLTAPHRASYELDVEWLHQEILPSLKVDSSQVSYTQDFALAVAELHSGKAQVLFLVQRPRLEKVLRRARQGVRMPAKTTYFYPKPLAGLVEYKF